MREQEEIEEAPASAMLVILFGASEFPGLPAWSNPELGASARAFRDYVRDPSGLGIPRRRVLDLFDDEADQVEQCLRIDEFLSREGTAASDLILYYIGHGTFDNDEYCLGIRSTQRGREYLTTIESRKLARSVRDHFRRKRVYLILDSCYAASAARDWQGDEVNHAIRKFAKVLPGHGTAFLAAASKDDVTRAPRAERYTVFTGALIEALNKGVPNGPERLSLSDLHEEVCALLLQRPELETSRPELHVPLQREGDISRLPMFPNRAHGLGHEAPRAPRAVAHLEELSPRTAVARTAPLVEQTSRASAHGRLANAAVSSVMPRGNALPGPAHQRVADRIAARLHQPVSARRVFEAIMAFFRHPLTWAFIPMVGPVVFLSCSLKVALDPAAASLELRDARTVGAFGVVTTLLWLIAFLAAFDVGR
jgi:Caspase domain